MHEKEEEEEEEDNDDDEFCTGNTKLQIEKTRKVEKLLGALTNMHPICSKVG